MESNIEYITKITYIFFIFLIMSVFIERVVELCVSVFNYADMKLKLHRIWNSKAHAYRERFDRLFASRGDATEINKMLLWMLWRVMLKKPYTGGKETISASLIRLNYIRLGAHILSFCLALIFVIIIRNVTGFDFLRVINELIPDSTTLDFLSQKPWLSVFITSLAISLGSEPLHQLISRIESIGEKKRKLKGGANESL